MSLFSRSTSHKYKPAIALFGSESSGKTRLCASASIWAKEHGTTPGWLITDPKTEHTLEQYCRESGLEMPLVNKDPFITPKEASDIIRLDRWIDTTDDKGRSIVVADPGIMKAYAAIVQRFSNAASELAADDSIDPVIIDSTTIVYNWMAYSHNGKKQAVGQQTRWGPPASDFKDLIDGLRHKTLIATFWAKDEWQGKETTGRTVPDGPKNLGYSVTSTVRLNLHKEVPCGKDDRYSLDVWVSQDNAGISGVNGLLKGSQIDFMNLLSLLRPELVT